MKQKIIKTALKTLKIEAETIRCLKLGINDDFANAVEFIYKSEGRLIITGIGKSALVAQKIVATLNSTGTPSIFMHAADAIHGDLGMMLPNDVVICISKSGSTPEIQVLLPFLKKLGNTTIAMVSNIESYLAQQSDFVIHTPISKEADPNNLAPTASTTAQMAMGDAIAMSLLALRGFTPNDFAQFHPGGSLGKQLYLKVDDIFIKNEKPAIAPDAIIREVILEITSKRLGATAVVDKKGDLLGMITDGDLRRMLEQETDLRTVLAKDIMTSTPHSIAAHELAVTAMTLMRKHSISQLIITEEKKYIGMIHLHDLIREGLV